MTMWSPAPIMPATKMPIPARIGPTSRANIPAARVATRAPRTYIYQDDGQPLPTPDNYVVKNLPPYHAPGTPAPRVASRSHTRYAAYQLKAYAPAPSAPMSFAWPANGAVISSFGSTASGERNVGINIAAGMGTPIRAAASGTVTYAGDELKSYGNLVLLKHEGGYATAYAHAERMVVHRGDVVSRGQVIAYTGKSGDVTSPQLHFEIRDGTMPVDPRKYLGPRPGHDGAYGRPHEGWRDDVVSRADDDDGDQPSF